MPESTSKVCIVTGASSGIGFAAARRFANEGYKLVLCGRRKDAMDRALGELEKLTTCHATVGDIGEVDTQQDLFDKTLEQFGRIDVLVNNAGSAPLGEFDSIETSVFETVIDVNIRAVFSMSQLVWPVMRKQGCGTIVNISSMAAVN
ncbi:MAG: SDR family oxidoreductase, partial [Planctomycetota bacterium]